MAYVNHYVTTDDGTRVNLRYWRRLHRPFDNGVFISSLFPFDPEFNESVGIRTVRDLIHWINNNRRLFWPIGGPSYEHEDMIYPVQSCMCDYFNRDWSDIRDMTRDPSRHNALVSYLDKTMDSPAITFKWFNDVRDGGGNTFYLVPQAHHLAAPIVDVSYTSQLRGTVRVSEYEGEESFPIGSHDSMWYRCLNYSFKMDPERFNFFRYTDRCVGKGDTMFGMEIEISTKLTPAEFQYIVTDVEPKQEPFFIMKSDASITGSLRNRFEIVTVPCTPRYLKREWRVFFNKLNTLIDDTGLCLSDYFDTNVNLNNGIHIHVGRDSFFSPVHQKKFLAAWNMGDHRSIELLDKMSRRPYSIRTHSFCSIDSVATSKLGRRLRHSYQHRGACHERNTETCEVRIFQGIFDFKHFIFCIEAVDAMVQFTNGIGLRCLTVDPDTRTSSFPDFFEKWLINRNGFRNLKEIFQCA